MNKQEIKEVLYDAYESWKARNELKNFIKEVIQIAVNEEDGAWITVRGRHIFIPEGKTLDEVIKEKGWDKKETNTPKENDKREELNKLLKDVKANNQKTYKMQDIFNILKDYKERTYTIAQLKNKIKKAEEYNAKATPTSEKYRNEKGEYTKERKERHEKIINDIFKNAENARPEKGKKPTFVFLGGRGGSGKSKFTKDGSPVQAINKDKFIILDADEIKKALPEYKGFNAAEVHEESSEIMKAALNKAKNEGLNVLLDATMKTKNSAEKKLKAFKDAGYNIEMYYMHLPREKAASRAFNRFMDDGGRYVPFKELMKMTDNEQNFDELKHYASKWAIYNNDVPSEKDAPILVDKNY